MSDIKGIKKFIRPILGVAFLCIVLASCKNFLNAGKVKEEIERSIHINNSECPVATVEEPVFSDAGVAKNKAIMVSFTMPIDPATFNESYYIEDASGNNLLNHFLEPKWSNENKFVTIVANENNPIDLRGKKTLDIYFRLTKNCMTPDALPIKAAINHKYRINDNLDETPPTISVESYAERPALYFNEDILIMDEYKLIEGNITSETEWNICWNNHINTLINFYIAGNDYGGGNVKGHIVCKRIRDVNGNDVSEKEKEKSFTVDDFKTVEGSDEKAAEYTLDLSGSEFNDGLYEIKVFVQDSTGTDSEECQTYYVVRDTTFEYCITSRMFPVAPQFRSDLTPGFNNPPNMIDDPNNPGQQIQYDYESESNKTEGRWYWGPETAQDFEAYYTDYLKTVPTKALINSCNELIAFQMISNDLFYKSKLTGENYENHDFDYTYYLSWGKSLDQLTKPVKITGHEDSWHNLTVYELPADYLEFYSENRNIDTYLCATIADVAGNTNTLINLCPKDIEFYSYKVEDSTAYPGKKKVTLNFSESKKIDYSSYHPLPDKTIDVRYRIYYGPADQENLKRNTSTPLERDLWSNESDSSIIDNLETGIYKVYIQPFYNFDSKINGMWSGSALGHLTEVSVNTGLPGDGNLPKPEIESFEKVSEGLNTGLFKITLTITQGSYNSIKQYEADTGRTVKFIPCFTPIREFDKDRNLVEKGWTYFDSRDIKADRTITFSVNNPLRAPFNKGDAWAIPKDNWPENATTEQKWTTLWWDGSVIKKDGKDKVWGDYTFFQAVEKCKEKYGYPDVESKIKIIVIDDEKDSNESDETIVTFCEDDDNIPPKISRDVVQHDGKLSYDGHSFEFKDLVYENEGHLSEYFNYYYMPYNPSWGDNLPEATSAIEGLPGGITKFMGSTYFDDNKGAEYTLPMVIPVFGLEDGQYMFFAKVSDTYGNYIYVTLGKVNIGTFKNKLKVELKRTFLDPPDPDNNPRHFQSTLQIEADERFERNMINLQEFADYKDSYSGEEVEKWGNYYYDINALQECLVENVDGKTILRNYNLEQCPYSFNNPKLPPFTNNDVFFVEDWNGDDDIANQTGPLGYPQTSPRNLYAGHWFRLTLQSFNENYIIPGVREDAVDRIYGRPYHYLNPHDYNPKDKDQYELWDRDIKGYIEGETKYDVCTQETVSNTVYFFVPGEWIETWGDGKFHYDKFDDFTASFFPSNATAISNYSFLINVLAAGRDLGRDPDEWERRGKLIATHPYEPYLGEPNKDDYRVTVTDSSGREPDEEGYEVTYHLITDSEGREPGDDDYVNTYEINMDRYNYDLHKYQTRRPDITPFSKSLAEQDMIDSKEKGLIYYAAVVHFANGTSAVSDTYMMYGF